MALLLPVRERHTRGDTFARMWVLRDVERNPLDLTGAQVRAQLRDMSDAVVAEASTTDGRIYMVPTEGTISMTIPFSAMEAVGVGQYRYDLEITMPSGYRRTVYSAFVDVTADVTR